MTAVRKPRDTTVVAGMFVCNACGFKVPRSQYGRSLMETHLTQVHRGDGAT